MVLLALLYVWWQGDIARWNTKFIEKLKRWHTHVNISHVYRTVTVLPTNCVMKKFGLIFVCGLIFVKIYFVFRKRTDTLFVIYLKKLYISSWVYLGVWHSEWKSESIARLLCWMKMTKAQISDRPDVVRIVLVTLNQVPCLISSFVILGIIENVLKHNDHLTKISGWFQQNRLPLTNDYTFEQWNSIRYCFFLFSVANRIVYCIENLWNFHFISLVANEHRFFFTWILLLSFSLSLSGISRKM